MTPWAPWALAGLGLVVGAAWAAGRVLRWRTSWVAGARARRGLAAESQAAALLASAGYSICERQPRARWCVAQDGAPREVALRGDYLVKRRGRRYLAEVKTGDAAELGASSATRRQLLEYQLAFGVDGILLVCPERAAVYHVEFLALRRGAPSRWPVLLIALAIGLSLGYLAAWQRAPVARPSSLAR